MDGLLLGFAEERAVAPVFEDFEMLGRPAEFEADGGVAGEAVAREVELRGANYDQLLELGGQRAGFEDGFHVRGRGAEDFGAMSERAEEVGHVAAFAQKLVVDGSEFGRNFGAVESADAWHGNPPCDCNDKAWSRLWSRVLLTAGQAFVINEGAQPPGCVLFVPRS
jgi:hypothetical protein